MLTVSEAQCVGIVVGCVVASTAAGTKAEMVLEVMLKVLHLDPKARGKEEDTGPGLGV